MTDNCLDNKVMFGNYIYIVVLNIINGNFELVKSWQKGLKPIGASVLLSLVSLQATYLSLIGMAKRLAQLDNQLYIRRETYRIL